MKSIIKFIRKYWIIACFVAAAVLLSGVVTYAIYTRITIAKRVVSTKASEGIPFTSDHMNANGMRSYESSSDKTSDVPVAVHVYNYVYPRDAIYRTQDTEYDLTATIGTMDDNGNFTELNDNSAILALDSLNYTISDGTTTFKFGTAGTSHTFSNCVLSGQQADVDLFNVVFDKVELGDTPNEYFVKLVAEPYDNDLPDLYGFVSARYAKQSSTGWNGRVEELDPNKDYDGFNYYLEGNGKGKITFKWNPTYVTINKQFLNNEEVVFEGGNTPVNAGNGMVSLTISVDSTVRNRYEIQFYKVDSSFDYSKAQVESYLPDTLSADWEPDEQD